MKGRFGEYIHDLRMKNGYTLTQLGAMLGVDSGALSKIENGKKQLDSKCLEKLSNVFLLDLEQLKDEYFSEKIAIELIENNCSGKVLLLAEQKAKKILLTNVKQAQIEF